MASSLRAALALLLLAAPAAAQSTFDLLIRDGLVVDGSGARGFLADVGIRDGWIVRVGHLSRATAERTIDASGLVVAPGFIDIHNHSDFTLLKEPRCESMIRQGVTTMVLGEGGSAGPVRPGEREWQTLGGYFRHVEDRGVATNIASYVKITSMNAEKTGVRDRGLIKEGFRADVTLFNPRTVIDRATFEKPHQYPEGIPYVVVNGVLVLDEGHHTGELPGQVIRGPGYRPCEPEG
jgi:N-acyl-D-aspartate/D-glutamate deacylase